MKKIPDSVCAAIEKMDADLTEVRPETQRDAKEFRAVTFEGVSKLLRIWYARVDSNHRPFAPEAKS